MTTIKVRKVGNSLGIVLTKELVARLRVTQGDQLLIKQLLFCKFRDEQAGHLAFMFR
jgi:putative addiction module antidote